MRSLRLVALVALPLVAAACKKDKPKEGETSAKAEEPPMDVGAFCQLVMGAPRRNLDASCTDGEKGEKAFSYLAGIADERVTACKKWLEPDVAAGRLQVIGARARACAAALEKASWKETLKPEPIARYSECHGMLRGAQPAGGACRVDATCAPGLSCVGSSSATDGTCAAQASASQACEVPAGFRAIEDHRARCGEGLACPPTPQAVLAARIFPLGYESLEPDGAPPPSKEAGKTDEQPSSSNEGGTGTRNKGEEGSMGRPANRYGVRGPEDSPDPHIARRAALRDAAEFGMIGLLDTSSGGLGQPARTGIRGLDCIVRGVPLELDQPMTDSFGAGGLGLTGFGESGGGRGEGIGLGSIGFGRGTGFGSGHRTRPPKVRMGATSVTGRLPPEVIQRIVRQNFGRFRLCYENGLRTNPNLEGRVNVNFVIGRDGSVSNVSGGGDMPDAGVISCVTRAFYGLSFPAPEGGIVRVSYPILFSNDGAGSTASASPSASAPPPPSEPPPSAPTAPARTEPTATASKCVAVESRALCSSDASCRAGERCVGVKCTDAVAAGSGERCTEPNDCGPGLYCSRAKGDESKCRPRKADGEACTSSIQCAGICNADGKCASFCDGR
jgi:hypothetical protein